ncbi:MAG TPA: hypothetical protein VHD61_05895 [Lacunisphaera sp.]|nr:hypothetical protein [Lacunisphaera sp.]
MNQPRPSARPLLTPGRVLVLLTVAGWLAFVLVPQLLVLVGISSYGMWYLDSYAVLAAVDAVRQGVPMGPGVANPLDPLGRDHKYSDWWFALRWLGLTREANFLVGTTWVGAFAVAVWATLRPRNFREAAWLALLLLAPGVVLAIHRANNDLVVFVLIAICGAAAADPGWGRQLIALGALVLATGLKFYPAPAALGFLWLRPVRRAAGPLGLALVGAGATLASVWPQLKRAQFTFEATVHTTGAPLLWRDLGWPDSTSLWFSVAIIGMGAVGLAATRCTAGLAENGGLRERFLAALGAIIVVACFVAGVSYAYRWVFALWMALWLWREVEAPQALRRRWTVRLGLGLLVACFWLDGMFCLVVNLGFMPMPAARQQALQLAWRLCTQPLQWLFVILLAGWLLEGALASVRSWRAERAAA